jgi:hypothetical protein
MVGNGKKAISYFVLPLELFSDKLYRLDLYNKSRVRGEFQARFCERLGVKLPLSTRSPTVMGKAKKRKS